MADYKNIIPFIKSSEGGYSNNPSDPGAETNKGITWMTWIEFFGNTHDRFMTMTDADWIYIFYNGYWKQIKGDQIANQAIADFLADWYWNSGAYAIGLPFEGQSYGVQQILNDNFGYNLATDGVLGPITLTAINSVDSNQLLDLLVQYRAQYFQAIINYDPTQQQFAQGWTNRLNSLFNTVAQYIGDVTQVVTQSPGISAGVVFFCLLHSLL